MQLAKRRSPGVRAEEATRQLLGRMRALFETLILRRHQVYSYLYLHLILTGPEPEDALAANTSTFTQTLIL